MVSRFYTAGLALILLTGGPARADGAAGYAAWDRGDYAVAVTNWRPIAIAGDSDAQYNMGQAYRLGRGVPAIDLNQAEEWFRKSAAQGNVKGKGAYGIVLFQNGKRAEAVPYLEEAAGAGNANAQYIYGTILFNGELAARDWPRAYAMMTRAAAGNIAPASSSLAQMDKVIPLDQRTRGLALARAFERAESRPLAPTIGQRAPGSVRTETLPPSEPAGLLPTPEPIDDPRPVRIVTTKPPAPKPLPPKPTVAIAKPVPTPVAAIAGNWRVQLGAFSDGTKASALWTGLQGRIAALGVYRPFIVKASPITRLQAGPLPSRAAADKLCAAVRAAGQACLLVAP